MLPVLLVTALDRPFPFNTVNQHGVVIDREVVYRFGAEGHTGPYAEIRLAEKYPGSWSYATDYWDGQQGGCYGIWRRALSFPGKELAVGLAVYQLLDRFLRGENRERPKVKKVIKQLRALGEEMHRVHQKSFLLESNTD